MKSWKKLLTDNFPILFFVGLVLLFFYPLVLFGKIPLPADTIVGMYHPWRDVVWDNYSSGVPFKNFLITDPVRQQYVWRRLAIEQWKKGSLPLWNPYSFSGTPLLANFQSAVFYPLNLLFFILPFDLAWGLLVLLQPVLSGVFLYLYLRNIRLSKQGSFLGALVFSFSGFAIAWLEWNTIGHVILWLPLALLSIEKITQLIHLPTQSSKLFFWLTVFTFSLISSFFAGHLQIFFYSLLIILLYLSVKIMLLKQNRAKIILLYVICFMLFVIVTSVQWLPTWQFISLSARDFDQGSWLKQGWFIPWQNLIQFLVPDFFGNPATGNYWGVWNYGEFIGFIGIIPLIFALYGLVFNISKKTLFFGFFLFFSLIFALPTWFAQFPFIWQIPLISSSQPTRLIFVVDFSLCILAALGFDHFNKDKNWKKITLVLLLLGLLFLLIWILVAIPTTFKLSITNENLAISKRNLILPTLLFTLGSMFIFLSASAKRKVFKLFYVLCFMLLVIFDLFRFGWKFTPFSKTAWVYPATKLTNILKKEGENYRIMSLDRRIMPPNFSTHYHIADIAGYDPLYLRWYGQLIAAWDRNKPDITPASFNRIITPMQFDNFIADLLGVKYFLSLEPINSTKLNLVESEGKTYLYENEHVSPRAFLVENVIEVKNPQEEIEKMFRLGDQLDRIAVTSGNINLTPFPYQSGESVKIITYSDNYIRLSAKTGVDRLLVLTDIYYPSWQVYLDGRKTALHRVDFALRGVIIPAGEHQVEFKANLL